MKRTAKDLAPIRAALMMNYKYLWENRKGEKMIHLTKEDWAEIYYALHWKAETFPDLDEEWLGHLRDIMGKIGVDGEEACKGREELI